MPPDDRTPPWDLLDHRDAGQVLSDWLDDWLDAHPEIDQWLPTMGQELMERRRAEMLNLTLEERERGAQSPQRPSRRPRRT